MTDPDSEELKAHTEILADQDVATQHSSTTPTTDNLEKSPAFYIDAVAYSAMLGLGENYLAPFAIWLKASAMQVGLLAGLPAVVGSLFQLLGVWIMERHSARKPLIVAGSLLQGSLWIPIALLPILFGQGPGTVSILIVIAALYFGSVNLAAPIWNSLVGDLITPSRRATVFAKRNMLAGWVLLLTLISAGWLLNFAAQQSANGSGEIAGSASLAEASMTGASMTGTAFMALFFLAAIARLISAWSLSTYPDAPYKARTEDYFSFYDFLSRSRRSNFARFVIFFALLNVAVSMAGPYFAVYMLRELKFSYLEFTILSAVGVGSQFILMKLWGPITDEFGTKRILTISSFGVSILPLFWLCTTNIYFLLLVQCTGGFFWAGFNLAATSFLFDAVTPGKRARCTAYMSVMSSAGIFVGAYLGGLLVEPLKVLYDTIQQQFPLDWLLSHFQLLFIASSLSRIIVILTFIRLFHEVRDVPATTYRHIIMRIANIRPITGAKISVVSVEDGEESQGK